MPSCALLGYCDFDLFREYTYIKGLAKISMAFGKKYITLLYAILITSGFSDIVVRISARNCRAEYSHEYDYKNTDLG
jgi:hypothetical protein